MVPTAFDIVDGHVCLTFLSDCGNEPKSTEKNAVRVVLGPVEGGKQPKAHVIRGRLHLVTAGHDLAHALGDDLVVLGARLNLFLAILVLANTILLGFTCTDKCS